LTTSINDDGNKGEIGKFQNDKVMSTKQGASTMENNLYLKLTSSYNELITNNLNKKKKMNLTLQQTLNLEQDKQMTNLI
jgi:outer membrane translocation and assembly module TamA